jgi:hypothetical protein
MIYKFYRNENYCWCTLKTYKKVQGKESEPQITGIIRIVG